MNSSDYIFSLRALNLWLENLEDSNRVKPDAERESVIRQVNECFNNVLRNFSAQYKEETGIEPPENLCEVMIYSKENRKVHPGHNFRREVLLEPSVLEAVKSLVQSYEYTKLKNIFCNYSDGRIYLNIEEAEALIELVIIEQKKALLKYPNYDKKLESYCQEDEDMVLNVQQGLYEKVVIGVTDVFKEFDRECLI